MASKDLGKYGRDLVIDAPVAAGYALLANWAFRKMGLSYGTRAAVAALAGAGVGYVLVRAGQDSLGKTIGITGVATGIVYGSAEVATRMFLGSPDSRQALATGATTTPTTTTTQALNAGAGRPALGAGQPLTPNFAANKVPLRSHG